MMLGGISDTEKPVTEELKMMLIRVQPEVLDEVRKSFNGPVVYLIPVSYESQMVAGVNYFVKYQLNESKVYYHVRIYKDLDNYLKVVRVSGPKTEADPIKYF